MVIPWDVTVPCNHQTKSKKQTDNRITDIYSSCNCMHKIHTRNYNGLALMSIFGRHRRQAHLSARHPASLAFASNRETVETTTANTEPTPPNFTKLRPEVVPCSWCSLRLQCQKNSQLIFFWDFTMSDHVGSCRLHWTYNWHQFQRLCSCNAAWSCHTSPMQSSRHNLLKSAESFWYWNMKQYETAPNSTNSLM